MIVDTSALVALVLGEPEAARIQASLGDRTARPGIGTPTLVELGTVLSARLGRDARPIVTGLLVESGIEIIPFAEPHWRAAVDAFLRFGRGRHPAGLNFGDCMSYAVAAISGEPLLCVGDDFPRTDILIA